MAGGFLGFGTLGFLAGRALDLSVAFRLRRLLGVADSKLDAVGIDIGLEASKMPISHCFYHLNMYSRIWATLYNDEHAHICSVTPRTPSVIGQSFPHNAYLSLFVYALCNMQ